jgi:hypothetical protein
MLNLVGFGPSDVWAGGRAHFEGATWTPLDFMGFDTEFYPYPPYAVWRTPTGEMLGVEGSYACSFSPAKTRTYSLVGQSWQLLDTGIGAALGAAKFWATDAWVSPAGHVWFNTNGGKRLGC